MDTWFQSPSIPKSPQLTGVVMSGNPCWEAGQVHAGVWWLGSLVKIASFRFSKRPYPRRIRQWKMRTLGVLLCHLHADTWAFAYTYPPLSFSVSLCLCLCLCLSLSLSLSLSLPSLSPPRMDGVEWWSTSSYESASLVQVTTVIPFACFGVLRDHSEIHEAMLSQEGSSD